MKLIESIWSNASWYYGILDIEDRYDQESLLEITSGGGGGTLYGEAPPERGTFY